MVRVHYKLYTSANIRIKTNKIIKKKQKRLNENLTPYYIITKLLLGHLKYAVSLYALMRLKIAKI